MNTEQFYGKKGEDITVDYLKKKGFIIFKRNYKSRYGEIDVIAEKGNLLLFVEVKTRSENSLTRPAEAVNYQKQRKIRLTAGDFLRKTHFDYSCRFDVSEINVTKSENGIKYSLNYIKDAFV